MGCQATRGGLPIGWGARVVLALRSLAGGNALPLLGVELRPESTKAPPTSSAKNTCVMATGRVREGGVVVEVVVVVAVVVVRGVKILSIK